MNWITRFKQCPYRYQLLLIALLTVGLNVLVTACCGAYLEEYESVIASLAHGQYFSLSSDFIFWDVNSIAALILHAFKPAQGSFQLYGLYLYLLNLVSCALLVTFSYRIRQSVGLTFLLALLLVPNMVCISTTRIVFVLAMVVFASYYKNENFKVLLGSLVFLVILRLDAAVLSGGIFLIVSNQRFIKRIIPMASLLVIYISFNVSVHFLASDPIQSFYFGELEIFDKSNIDFDQLDSITAKKIMWAKDYLVLDAEFFNPQFYEDIKKVKAPFQVSGLLNASFFIEVLLKSRWNFLEVAIPLLLGWILLIIATFKRTISVRVAVILTVLPAFLACVIVVPTRFLYPFSIFVILFALSKVQSPFINKKTLKTLFPAAVGVVLITYNHVSANNIRFENYRRTTYIIRDLNRQFGPVYFENIYGMHGLEFFNCNVFSKTQVEDNVRFLNLYYLMAYGFYSSNWIKDGLQGNPLSLKDKLSHIASKNGILLLNPNKLTVYSDYLESQSPTYKIQPSLSEDFKHTEYLLPCTIQLNNIREHESDPSKP